MTDPITKIEAMLLQRIEQLEKRVAELDARTMGQAVIGANRWANRADGISYSHTSGEPDSSPEQAEALDSLKTVAEITDEIEVGIDESFALAEALFAIRSYIQRAVPEGLKLAPLEPTTEMIKAAQDAWLGDPARKSSTLYRAMLKAAPRAGGGDE